MPNSCHVIPTSRYGCIAIGNHGGVSNLLDPSNHARLTCDHAILDDHVDVRCCPAFAEQLAAILSLRNLTATGVDDWMAYELHCLTGVTGLEQLQLSLS